MLDCGGGGAAGGTAVVAILVAALPALPAPPPPPAPPRRAARGRTERAKTPARLRGERGNRTLQNRHSPGDPPPQEGPLPTELSPVWAGRPPGASRPERCRQVKPSFVEPRRSPREERGLPSRYRYHRAPTGSKPRDWGSNQQFLRIGSNFAQGRVSPQSDLPSTKNRLWK